MNRTNLLLLAVVVLLGGVCYLVYIANSSPGREDTRDQDGRNPSPRPNPAGPLEPLSMAWDSEAFSDWPVAELLGSISETSYLPPVDVDPALRSLGFKQVMAIVDSSMIGYVASADDMTVIVFRGTDNEVDWFVNMAGISQQTPSGAIHRGFYRAYQPLKPQIVKLVKAAKPKHLWITGHSLGGALAVVCAYDLIENEHLQVDGLITFGQPMVAKSQLAQRLDKLMLGRYAHYVNEDDFVARIPPNFSHFGSLVWFTEQGIKRSKAKRIAFGAPGTKASSDSEGVEIPPASEREFEQWKSELRLQAAKDNRPLDDKIYAAASFPWIEDHSMRLYLEKIRSVTAKPNAIGSAHPF